MNIRTLSPLAGMHHQPRPQPAADLLELIKMARESVEQGNATEQAQSNMRLVTDDTPPTNDPKAAPQ